MINHKDIEKIECAQCGASKFNDPCMLPTGCVFCSEECAVQFVSDYLIDYAERKGEERKYEI